MQRASYSFSLSLDEYEALSFENSKLPIEELGMFTQSYERAV